MLRRNARARPKPGPRHLTPPPPSCKCAAANVTADRRFGRPSTYSLSRAELERHVRRLGWMAWENAARFDFSFWDAA
jgi:hypothetical protein